MIGMETKKILCERSKVKAKIHFRDLTQKIFLRKCLSKWHRVVVVCLQSFKHSLEMVDLEEDVVEVEEVAKLICLVTYLAAEEGDLALVDQESACHFHLSALEEVFILQTWEVAVLDAKDLAVDPK